MLTNQFYLTWVQQIRELRPGQRITQIRNFVLLMYGIYQSRSVYLSRIAGKLSGTAKLQSTVKRFELFLTIRPFGFANGIGLWQPSGWYTNLQRSEKPI
jgi:hypothetical protein